MSYSKENYKKTQEIIDERREKALRIAEEHKDKFFAECPEAKKFDDDMKKAAFNSLKVIGFGDGGQEYVEKLKTQSLFAQNEIKKLLTENNHPQNWLQPDFTCKKCNDTGKKDGRLCDCFKELMRKFAYDELCRTSSLKVASFDDFNLDFYSEDDRPRMRQILEFCKSYAENFDGSSKSLLMIGTTGLGKTHLSLSIAKEVLMHDYAVVYDSAQTLFSKLEREHFGKTDEPDGKTESLINDCDLLILDDLGAEFMTSFTVAELGNIVNTRMVLEKPTIINTNLNLKELQEKYSQRIVSRLVGEYTIVNFVGNDIRQIKKRIKND